MADPNFLGLAIKGDLQGFLDGELYAMRRGAMKAARTFEQKGKSDLRSDVERAGLGRRMANTWRSVTFPGGQTISLYPTVIFESKADAIINAFEHGAEIKSKSGKWLTIPTHDFIDSTNTSEFSQNRRNLVKLAEKKFGELKFVPIKGRKLGLLVTKEPTRRRASRYPKKPGQESKVLFFLVPSARLRQRLNYRKIF